MKLDEVEQLEKKYLDKFYYFFRYIEDELLDSFKSGKEIESDWKEFWGDGISSFSTGFERVIYNYFNSRIVKGEVNSSPVASDLFFETKDAYIHIDIKTVQIRNIGDINGSIFVGRNQNSYDGVIKTNKENREYKPAIPHFYSNGKVSLSYFLNILYDDTTLNILKLSLISMPNGVLKSHYRDRPLKAGKLKTEARFNFQEVSSFELLENRPSRIRTIYLNSNISEKYKKILKIFIKNFTQ